MQQPTDFAGSPSETAVPGLSDLTRFGGLNAIIGASLMVLGAILWQVSGVDLDAALAAGDMAGYLADAAGSTLVVLNLTAWIIGVLFLGAAGAAFAGAPGNAERPAHLAAVAFRVAVPLAIGSFIAMLAVVVRIPAEPSAAELAAADLVGWLGSRADWTATVLLVGFGPALASWAGRDAWAPGWLVKLGWLAGLAGVATTVAMFTDALSGYGFLVVPVGLIWMFGAGVATLRGG